MAATRRHLLMAPIGLGAPYIRPAFAARSLTLAGFGGMFQELYEPIAASLPGSELFYYAVPSSATLLGILRRQRERPEIDVALLEAGVAHQAFAEDLLEPLTPAALPVLADLAPGGLPAGFAGPVLYTEPLMFLYDAARPAPPPIWKLLWARSQNNDVAVPAIPDSIGVALTLIAGKMFGGGDLSRIVENGIVAMSELSERIASWDPRPDVYRFVADGGARYGAGWNMTAQRYADRLARPLGVAFPAEGTVARAVTVNLVKGARQPDAARRLIAHLLGPAAQRSMMETMYLGPVNTKTKYPEAALQRTAHAPQRAAAIMPVDWPAVARLRESMLAQWREALPNAG